MVSEKHWTHMKKIACSLFIVLALDSKTLHRIRETTVTVCFSSLLCICVRERVCLGVCAGVLMNAFVCMNVCVFVRACVRVCVFVCMRVYGTEVLRCQHFSPSLPTDYTSNPAANPTAPSDITERRLRPQTLR